MDWKEIIKRIREKTKEGRELEYKEGEVGITSLLQCPLKAELRRKYPNITVSAVEIDDGYLWEQQVKGVLREIFGEAFREEYELIDEVEGQKIRGHLDCLIENGEEIIGVELKSPKALLLKDNPSPQELIDGVFLIDETEKYVIHNELYYKQAQIQKYILKKLFPGKKVRQYLFYKAPCRRGKWERKLYVLAPVTEDISGDEYRDIVKRFKEDKTPRFPLECENYCEFYRAGVCSGKEFKYADINSDELPQRVIELVKEYRRLQSDLKNMEIQLKKLLKGSVKFGEREIGWVCRKTLKLDERKIAFLLRPEEIPNYFVLRWKKKEELVKKFGSDVVVTEEEERVWRI